MPKTPKPDPRASKAINLEQAIRELLEAQPVARENVLRLIAASAQALRQGDGLHWAEIDVILDRLFPPAAPPEH